MADLGSPQISALLESVPGIANVLRSPVANALVNMIRAGARVGEFRQEDARELVNYAVRRGLIGSDEGDRLLSDIKNAGRGKPAAAAVHPKPAPQKQVAPPRRPAASARKPAKARKTPAGKTRKKK